MNWPHSFLFNKSRDLFHLYINEKRAISNPGNPMFVVIWKNINESNYHNKIDNLIGCVIFKMQIDLNFC